MNMLIDAEQTKNVEVEISEFTAKKIAKDVIMAALDLPVGCAIEHDNLVQEHRDVVKIIRPATEEDKAGCLVLGIIEKW